MDVIEEALRIAEAESQRELARTQQQERLRTKREQDVTTDIRATNAAVRAFVWACNEHGLWLRPPVFDEPTTVPELVLTDVAKCARETGLSRATAGAALKLLHKLGHLFRHEQTFPIPGGWKTEVRIGLGPGRRKTPIGKTRYEEERAERRHKRANRQPAAHICKHCGDPMLPRGWYCPSCASDASLASLAERNGGAILHPSVKSAPEERAVGSAHSPPD